MKFALLAVLLVACSSPSSSPGDGGLGSGSACQGCVADGVCVPGTTNAACGRDGDACSPCTGETSCEDQACLPPAQCDATTCPTGCCDDNDACQPGTTLSACGGGGERCETCANGSCTAGACALGCDAATCDGCCTAQGQCITATSATQCGKNGDACEACSGGLGCSDGECADTSCTATCSGCCTGSICNETSQFDSAACGDDGDVCRVCGAATICTNGDCVPDNLTRWDLVILSGIVSATNPQNGSWDAFGGLPDPKLCVGSQDDPSVCVAPISNTLTPVWNGGAVIAANLTPSDIYGNLFWSMYDHDPTSFDDIIGICLLQEFRPGMGYEIFDGNVHTFECTPANASGNGFFTRWSVRYKLVRKQ